MRLAVLLILAVATLSGCDSPLLDPCSETVKREVPSPNGRYIAAIYEIDCGATTNYSTNVTIREANQSLDTKSQERILTVEGQFNLGVQWQTDDSLVMTGAPTVTFRKLENWRDVRISYRSATGATP